MLPTAKKIPKKKQRFIIGPTEIILIIGMALAVLFTSLYAFDGNPQKALTWALMIVFFALVVVILAYLNRRMAKK
jgi:membrane protein implicated in regulation of membrane protease activity